MDIDHVTWRKSSYSGANGGNCIEVGVWRKASYSGANGGGCVEAGLWTKATYSGGNGGACVEAGLWTTSSYTSGNGGNCVEVTRAAEAVVGVRDSKDPDGPRLAFTPAAWQTFLTHLKQTA